MAKPGFLNYYSTHMERRGITYEDLCESCSSTEVIAKIAAKFDIWEEASPHLGL